MEPLELETGQAGLVGPDMGMGGDLDHMTTMDGAEDAGEPQDDPAALAPPPVDPLQNSLLGLLHMPGADAVRRVYQLAVSAARAKVQLRSKLDQMDARAYHATLSASPEARYADELGLARRELDVLAQERRRLSLEAVKARDGGRPASIYELQAEGATRAMEAVALGVLLFLTLPSGLPPPPPSPPAPLPAQNEELR